MFYDKYITQIPNTFIFSKNKKKCVMKEEQITLSERRVNVFFDNTSNHSSEMIL